MPSFPIHPIKFLETLARAPITTGKNSTFLNSHNLLISFFKFWYFYTFSFSFSSIFTSAGTTISIIITFCFFLSITITSGSLASIRLSHWIFMSYITLIFLFHTALSRACFFHCSLCSSPFFLQIFQPSFFVTLSCWFLYSFGANFLHLLVMCWTLSPFLPHNLHRKLSLVLLMWYFIQLVLITGSCAVHKNASVATFKPPLDNHYHVSSLATFSVVSLVNFLCIRFSLHFSFSSFAFCF